MTKIKLINQPGVRDLVDGAVAKAVKEERSRVKKRVAAVFADLVSAAKSDGDKVAADRFRYVKSLVDAAALPETAS